MRLGAAMLLAVLCAGCALTPDYERPALEMPDSYREEAPDGASIANIGWWDLFRDAQLQQLIETALQENKDLGVALQRILEARSVSPCNASSRPVPS
jgi:multidrug efflux system outer membrane protein